MNIGNIGSPDNDKMCQQFLDGDFSFIEEESSEGPRNSLNSNSNNVENVYLSDRMLSGTAVAGGVFLSLLITGTAFLAKGDEVMKKIGAGFLIADGVLGILLLIIIIKIIKAHA